VIWQKRRSMFYVVIRPNPRGCCDSIVFSWIVHRNRRNGNQPLLMVRKHASLWNLRNPITSLTAKENVVQLSLLPAQQPPLQQLLPQQPQRNHHVSHQEGKDVTGGPCWTWRRRRLYIYSSDWPEQASDVLFGDYYSCYYNNFNAC
jgi:hypothetical protein